MKSLRAAVVITAVLGLGSPAFEAHARTRSLESFGCLFELASKPVKVPVIAFSFQPLAERLASYASARLPERSVMTQSDEPEHASPAELSTSFEGRTQPLAPAPAADPTTDWPLLEAVRHFRSNPRVDGFSRNLGDASSYIALDYSDIFESGRAPYKGSHGVSLFFRHDF